MKFDMKKVIICLLLLIPILVILTIDASGKLIVSASVDIPAETMIIKHEGEELKSDEVYLEEYKDTGRRYTLFCEFFPGIATDEIMWESSNPQIAKVFKDEKRENAAYVEFYDYGSVDIVCTSKKNTSITAQVTIYVGGKVLNSITIGDAQGKELKSTTLDLWDEKNFYAFAKPARSVLGEKYQWSSSDERVAKVDDNGIVTACGVGSAVIKASITANEVSKSASMTVNVVDSDKNGFKKEVIYAAGASVDLTPYLVEGWSTENVIDISAMEPWESVSVQAKKGDAVDTVKIVKLRTEKTLLVDHYDILTGEGGAISSPLPVGSADIRLIAFAYDGSEVEVTWHSDDESILEILDGNRIKAIASGKAKVYPTAPGYEDRQEVEIEVCSAVESFRLADMKDAVGIMQEKVYANKTLRNGNYTNQYAMRIESSYPNDVGIDAFNFYSSDEEIATVNAKGVVTFADDVDGKDVKITVTAYNHNGQLVEESKLFHLVNGVNVGLGVEQKPFDREKGEEPDFSVYRDFKAVSYDSSVKAIVLHTDVYYPSVARGGETILNPTASIYGNGKKLDGQFFIHSVEDTDKLILWNFTQFEKVAHFDLGYYNLYFQATQPTSEDSKEAFAELSAKGGGALGTKGGYSKGGSLRVTVKGCVFQYSYGHVNLGIGDFLFDGCIFRNNSASAIVLQQSSYGVANAKIRNCIFSNTIAPVGIACGNFDDILARNAKKEVEMQEFGKFELEGNNYVYNWKKLDEVQMDLLPQGLQDQAANALVSQFNGYLTKVIHQAFQVSDEGNLYIDENGEEWLNFSFLMIGIWLDMNPHINMPGAASDGLNVSFDPANYKCYEVNAADAPSTTSLKPIAAAFGVDLEKNKTYHIVCRDNAGRFNTMPGEEYSIDETTYARLRGEG